eukprot:253062-Pelagomonas_calceolata.AAC.1
MIPFCYKNLKAPKISQSGAVGDRVWRIGVQNLGFTLRLIWQHLFSRGELSTSVNTLGKLQFRLKTPHCLPEPLLQAWDHSKKQVHDSPNQINWEAPNPSAARILLSLSIPGTYKSLQSGIQLQESTQTSRTLPGSGI